MTRLSTAEREKMKAELCRILTKIGALKFGAFKLAGGKISPYYIDLRIVPSFPEAFQKVNDYYVTLIKQDVGIDKFERVAGIPTAGMAFASLIAYHLKKPFLYSREQAKAHGRERKVEGIIMPGDLILLADDLITTGQSLRKAASAMRAEGGEVNDAVVLVDREEGGSENLAKDKIKLHCLLKVSEAANKLYQMGTITEEEYKTITKQVRKK